MKRILTLLVPLSLVFAACGGDDDAPAPPDTAAERDVRGDDDDGDTDDRDDAGDGDAAGGEDADVGSPPPGDSSTYCVMARAFQETSDELDELDPFDFSEDAFRQAFDMAAEAIGQMRRVAPDEIRTDIEVFSDAFGEFRAELESVDYDFFQLDFEAFIEIGDAMDAASRNIEEYNERVCGIPRSDEFDFDDDFDFDFDDDFGDLEELFENFDFEGFDFDDFDFEGFEDMFDFGDLDELFEGLDGEGFGFEGLDLDGLGGFSELIRQELVKEYLSDGHSQAEAECLAEAVLSLDFSGSFEDFEDPYETCGVTP